MGSVDFRKEILGHVCILIVQNNLEEVALIHGRGRAGLMERIVDKISY